MRSRSSSVLSWFKSERTNGFKFCIHSRFLGLCGHKNQSEMVFQMIRIVRDVATENDLSDMLEALIGYIKVAVDIRREILAGGGILHADCEAVLLKDGSKQEDIWGADWNPFSKEVSFESLINIRPRQGNRSMRILNPEVRLIVKQIVLAKLGGVNHA